jgi:hypothetical protein
MMMPPIPTSVFKILGYMVMIAAIVALILTALHFLPGCMTAPHRENYSCEECFTAMDCLYRLKDDKDKAACAQIVEACRDTLKERRIKERLEYCAKSKPEKISEAECRLLLNQK